MKKRNIQIDLNTAKEWYLSRDSFKQELALQAFTKKELEEPKLPRSWKEYLECKDELYANYSSYFDTQLDMYKNLESLFKLLILRDVYRQGWKPDWTKSISKWCISFYNNEPKIIEYSTANEIFSFPTEELAEQFLENFKDGLKQLKELL